MLMGGLRGTCGSAFCARWVGRASFPLAALLLAATVLISAPTASAQDTDGARARAQFDAGVRLFAEANYRGALDAFQRAYDIKPHPVVRLNLASCYEKLDMPVQAYENYDAFLREMPGATAVQKREVQRALRGLRQSVGELSLDGVTPSDATVTVDGAPVRVTPGRPLYLPVGNHTVRATREGYAEASKDVVVRSGRQQKVVLALEELAAGSTAIAAAAPEAFEDEDGSEIAVGAEPAEGGRTIFTTPVIVAGGVAVALAVGAVVTGVMALSAKSDFDKNVVTSNDPDASAGARDRAYRDGVNASDRAGSLSLVSDILLGSAIVAGGVAVYFALTSDDDNERPETARSAVGIAPAVAAHGGGFIVTGEF